MSVWEKCVDFNNIMVKMKCISSFHLYLVPRNTYDYVYIITGCYCVIMGQASDSMTTLTNTFNLWVSAGRAQRGTIAGFL